MRNHKFMAGLAVLFGLGAIAVFAWALGDLARFQSWLALIPVSLLGLGFYCAHQAFILWAQSAGQNRK